MGRHFDSTKSLKDEAELVKRAIEESGKNEAIYRVNYKELARRMNEATGWKSTEDIVDFA